MQSPCRGSEAGQKVVSNNQFVEDRQLINLANGLEHRKLLRSIPNCSILILYPTPYNILITKFGIFRGSLKQCGSKIKRGAQNFTEKFKQWRQSKKSLKAKRRSRGASDDKRLTTLEELGDGHGPKSVDETGPSTTKTDDGSVETELVDPKTAENPANTNDTRWANLPASDKKAVNKVMTEFGAGPSGARELLQQVKAGNRPKPEHVSDDALRIYRDFVQSRYDDLSTRMPDKDISVMKDRLEIYSIWLDE